MQFGLFGSASARRGGPEFDRLCVPMEEPGAGFDECLRWLLKGWTVHPPFSHGGKYWAFNNSVVEPPSAQTPPPPIWMGAGSERSIRQVAQKGYNLLLGQYASPEDVGRSIALFRDAVEANGRRFDPMQVGVTRAFFVTDSKAEKAAAMERRLQNRM